MTEATATPVVLSEGAHIPVAAVTVPDAENGQIGGALNAYWDGLLLLLLLLQQLLRLFMPEAEGEVGCGVDTEIDLDLEGGLGKAADDNIDDDMCLALDTDLVGGAGAGARDEDGGDDDDDEGEEEVA